MLTPLQQRLSGGDRKSIGDAHDVARDVLSNPSLLSEVIDGIRSEDAILRSRCAHVLMTVATHEEELIAPYKTEILDEFSQIDQWEVREQMSKLIPRLPLNTQEIKQAHRVFDMYLTDKSSIVRTCALQGEYDLLRFDRTRAPDVRSKLETIQFSGTAAMRARSRILLAELDKRDTP